ncbi:MAG: hypothetical protein N3A69_01020 [Leptospiraceae bacterium]|nr:hypothetical protein [Leptospiraceae bacterium]
MMGSIFSFILCFSLVIFAEEQPLQIKPPHASEKQKEIAKHAEDKSKKPKKPKAIPQNSPPPSSNLSKPKGSE